MTITDYFGKASIDTDYAIATTVDATRTAGVTVLDAVDLSKFADDTPVFVVTYKKTTDPLTGVVSVVDLVSWKALVNTGANTLTNLTLAPGYTDLGNDVGDFIECMPTAYWVNSMMDGIFVGHNPDGTLKDGAVDATAVLANSIVTNDKMATDVKPYTLMDETTLNFVASGLTWSGDAYASTRNASMTAGVVYINGIRLSVALVTARAFTASKDTYIDVNSSGVLVYTEVANNAASPALASNSIRIGIIVTGATNIAAVGSINQGQKGKLLPIVSSTPYAVTDSLGNRICNRNPHGGLYGYREMITTFATAVTTATAITGLSFVAKVPANRKYKVTLFGPEISNNTLNAYAQASICLGSASDANRLAYTNNRMAAANMPVGTSPVFHGDNDTSSEATLTIIGCISATSGGGTTSIGGANVGPVFIALELE